jgi:hypothetical protein
MATDRDDDALAWAGDEPTTPEPASPRVELVDAPAAVKPSMPAPVLVTYGILAGVYLIYTIGWVITVQRYNAVTPGSVEVLSAVMFQLGEFLAIASPALWFAAALLLTRSRKPVVRLLVLLAGVVAVLPWPFVLGAWV